MKRKTPQTHAKTIALEANVSARQAAAVRRMAHEHSSAQRVRQGRQEELEQALAAGKTALEERKAKEAERNKQRHDAYAHKALRPRLLHAKSRLLNSVMLSLTVSPIADVRDCLQLQK